ncbi:MAG TPA: hypothetical protein VI072_27290 [Polyangiaceae bacterium]
MPRISSSALFRPIVTFESGEHWHPAVFVTNMRPHWGGLEVDSVTIDLSGSSYAVFPAAGPCGSSRHFDPQSDYFQALVGVYVVPPIGGRPVDVKLFGPLGNRDNVAWQGRCGNPNASSVTKRLQLRPLEAGGSLIAAACRTGIDVGVFVPDADADLLRPPSSLWEGQVRPFEPLDTSIFAMAWHTDGHLIVAYAISAVFQPWSQSAVAVSRVEKEQLTMIHSVRVVFSAPPFVPPPEQQTFSGVR